MIRDLHLLILHVLLTLYARAQPLRVTSDNAERFVTDQATYRLAGPPELRWGNLKGVSACIVDDTTFVDKQSHRAQLGYTISLAGGRLVGQTPRIYIARRVRFLQELVTRKIVVLLNIDGKQNPADALTKHIEPKTTFRDYMARLYNATASLFRFSHTISMAHPAKSSETSAAQLPRSRRSCWGGRGDGLMRGKRADIGAFQGENAGLMWGDHQDACLHGMSSTPQHSTSSDVSPSGG